MAVSKFTENRSLSKDENLLNRLDSLNKKIDEQVQKMSERIASADGDALLQLSLERYIFPL